jgi:hypothetical protein
VALSFVKTTDTPKETVYTVDDEGKILGTLRRLYKHEWVYQDQNHTTLRFTGGFFDAAKGLRDSYRKSTG